MENNNKLLVVVSSLFQPYYLLSVLFMHQHKSNHIIQSLNTGGQYEHNVKSRAPIWLLYIQTHTEVHRNGWMTEKDG